MRNERIKIMWLRAEDHARIHTGPGHELWDVYIFGARYGGAYEGGKWIAWIGDHEWLDDHMGDDVSCPGFWDDYRMAPIGRGDTPNEALADLHRICVEGRERFVPPTAP
jgi:hypothetical protein